MGYVIAMNKENQNFEDKYNVYPSWWKNMQETKEIKITPKV